MTCETFPSPSWDWRAMCDSAFVWGGDNEYAETCQCSQPMLWDSCVVGDVALYIYHLLCSKQAATTTTIPYLVTASMSKLWQKQHEKA